MIQCGMIMDPIAAINIHSDTSFALLLAAQQRGWQLHYFELPDIFLLNGQIYGRSRLLRVQRQEKQWFIFEKEQMLPLNQLNLLLIRKDPPFDANYLVLTQLLDRLETQGTLILNRPQALRDCNEKLFATWFADLMPATLVTQQMPLLRQFHQQQGEIILKPLDGMGGRSVVYLQATDRNASALIELLTDYGQRFCMAQRYLPEIQQGDKRLLMVDGQPFPFCLARIPATGELRGNLAAGGLGEVRPLTAADQAIAQKVGPVLKEKGLLFVGLDIIGNYLTEINVTSPTGLQAIEAACPLSISGQLFDIIEQQLAHPTPC
ncbi:MAG: glutathione synthase [Candidatus Symbiodolus clandestinus]